MVKQIVKGKKIFARKILNRSMGYIQDGLPILYSMRWTIVMG